MLRPRHLPGVRVDIAPPPATQALPRMDIAVLVGFASIGPVHIPVLVGSVAEYAAVFGSDAPLAWDELRGERVFAYLGAAVRGFFGNGGQRCWVIRVARTAALEAARGHREPGDARATAVSNRFAIPGVLEVRAGSDVSAALAEARSEGSWSDSLTVGAALSVDAFAIEGLTAASSPADGNWLCRSRQRLVPGDLIELRDRTLRLFATVISVHTDLSRVGALNQIALQVCGCFERVDSSSASSPPEVTAGTATLAGDDATFDAMLTVDTEAAQRVSVCFAVAAARSPVLGQWLRWTDDRRTLWVRIDGLARAATATSVMSPGNGIPDVSIEVSGPAWRELTTNAHVALENLEQAFRLQLELRVTDAAGIAVRLDRIGLTPEHERAWWQQLSDAQFYRALPNVPPSSRAPITSVRFPLAASASPAKNPAVAWIPLGVEPLFSAALPAISQVGTALERDGLGSFDSSLFMDPELADFSTDLISARADALRLLEVIDSSASMPHNSRHRLKPPGSSRKPTAQRELFGMHAALSIGAGGLFNEASLLCVPDAVHPGWTLRDRAELPSAEQEVAATPAHWLTHRGGCVPTPAPSLQAPDAGAFLDCATRKIESPQLFGPGGTVASAHPYRLFWMSAETGVTFDLQEARDATLSDAHSVYVGTEREVALDARRDGVYYYQVIVRAGEELSAPSAAVVVRVLRDEWRVLQPESFSRSEQTELLRVHRSMLRTAAANGDLFAVLALPRHFDSQHAIEYVTRLQEVRGVQKRTGADALAFNEARVLSYGAVYHPWLLAGSNASSGGTSRLSSQRTRIVPPDGVITGVFAARAANRGAWIAPANEVFTDVVAVIPEIAPGEWQSLQDAAVNVVRRDPRGVLALSADTLAIDAELRPVNVRRLLTLLRRLTLRRGVDYAFEPNGAVLRRAVQRGFDLLLTDLFQRGAFSGKTATDSFRVVTDDTINTLRDQDAGRFIVELRVAPSAPLRFISVRLAQSGERLSVTEEF